MRSTIPDFLNAGHALQFRQSRLKLFGIFLMCAAMTVVNASLGYHWMPNPIIDWRIVNCQVIAPIFAMITLFAFYKMLFAHRKGIVLTKTGVADHRIGPSEIPWRRIDAVREGKNASSRVIVLRLSSAADAPKNLFLSLGSKMLGLDATEWTISAAGLKVGHDALLEAISTAWRAARPRRPDQS
jgi:hypothetical protein